MKICSKCQNCIPIALFDRANKNKDGYKNICKSCCSINNKHLYNTTNRKELVNTRRNSVISYNKKFIMRYKRLCGCIVCNEDEVSVLDFHHIDNTKEYNIASMVSFTITKLKNEMRKCIVICSNCHRKLHANKFCLLTG